MKYILSIVLLLSTLACDTAKQKAKEAVNKSGQIVGQAGSEFAEGVARGVGKTFSREVGVSDALTKAGLRVGRVTLSNADSGTDNKLTIYLIFNNDFDGSVTAKVFDTDGPEYGRSKLPVKGKKGDAAYFDFKFDPRTNIDIKGKLTLE